MSATSSGRLGAFKTDRYLCVEYPGYIKDVEGMLKTLGGEEQLSDTYFNTKRRVELHFRPSDPYCHSVCGDLQPSRALLVKLKRRRKKNPSNEPVNEWKYEQEVIGIVHNTYRFMSLVDFQYITPKPLQNAFSTVETSSLLDEQQPLHIVPAIFSRIDVQGSYNYHPETFNRLGTKGNPAHRESLNPEEEIPHQFMSLVDFQYITPKPLQNAFSTVETSSLLDEQQPLHIVPAIFSRIDVQGSYNYHPETFNRLGTKGNPAHRESLNPEEEIPHQQSDSRMRKRRPSEAMAAIFTSKEVPQEPGAKCREIVDSTKKKFSWVESSLEELRELFRERPMWSRTALVCHLSTEIKNERLKQLLPYVAFYWLNGPWRALWNRFGYDPRKLPEAKIYQICDFRVRDKKDSKGLPILPLRSSRICTLPVQLQRYKVNAAVSVDNQQKPEAKRSAIPPEDLLYTFHPDKLPRARQIMYQLCDLYDDEVQQIISENNGKNYTTRSKRL
ncbi:general transcription factor 3C polypeptide 5-like isoform X2 [Rhopilema esculentum]|uniref:general transcription factor 3C polypeptide 5-like isoform X2 n=1 Tax=Rhopilema esculentum TaxID=499914 RepID=UPI0031D75DD0